MFKKIFKNLDLIIASIYLLIMFVTCCYSVFMRFFFNSPVQWFEAFAKFSLMVIVLIAGPYVARHDGHIVMREFLFMMPKIVQKIIFYVTDVVCVGFYIFIAYSAVIVTSKNMGSTMLGFNQPYWQFYAPVIIGFILLAVMYIYNLYSHIRYGIPKPMEVEEFDFKAEINEEV